jgi:hypothetical protein
MRAAMLSPGAYNRLLTEEEVRPIWEAWIKQEIEQEEKYLKQVKPIVSGTLNKERRSIDPALTARFSGSFSPEPVVSPRYSSPRAVDAQRSPRVSTEVRKVDTPVRSNTPRYDSTVRTPKSTQNTK